MAMYGRHGEAPVPIVAPTTPADCFAAAYEAVRIAVKYMTPVIVLSDGYLANGAEPWLIPSPASLAPIDVQFRTDPEGFFPYVRDPETLARPWVRPGTPGLEHRIGGLNKAAITGDVSYAPANHEEMVRTRLKKVQNIARELPSTEVFGADRGDLLVLGWGSTFGAIRQTVTDLQREGRSVAHAHLRWVNPLPQDLGDVLARYRAVLVPEINMGQLVRLVRAEYLVPAISYPKIQGRPFKVTELKARCEKILAGEPLEEVA
jgi:2-oxoglutarate ferredoxin oxidoreductase subunit alpha